MKILKRQLFLGSQGQPIIYCQSNFFPGEGMISMAHAFNYAESEHVLTGLWKIDEHASILITEAFYKNLDKGMTKDVVLQQTKLYYHKPTDEC